MSLLPEIATGLAAAAGLPPLHALTPAEARLRDHARFSDAMPMIALPKVADLDMPGDGRTVRARLYAARSNAAASCVLFFHGGGFVLGSIESHDRLCRMLAFACGLPVLSVDYRLAPEHRWPAAVEDADLALAWLDRHGPDFGIDTRKVVLAGDSAGGALTHAAALRADSQTRAKVASLALAYPVAAGPGATFSSHEARGIGFGLTSAGMSWFWSHYLGAGCAAGGQTGLAPLEADHRGFCPTFILTAEYDPLRDEGHALVDAMRCQGVAVEHRHEARLNHGFLSLAGAIGPATESLVAMAEWISMRVDASVRRDGAPEKQPCTEVSLHE